MTSLNSSQFLFLFFFSEFDDYLYYIFIPMSTQKTVALEMGREGHNDCNQQRNKKYWWFNRLYCLGLLIVALLYVTNPNYFIAFNFLAASLPSFQRGYAVCSDLANSLYITMSLLPTAFSLAEQFLFASTKWYIKLRDWILCFLTCGAFLYLVEFITRVTYLSGI